MRLGAKLGGTAAALVVLAVVAVIDVLVENGAILIGLLILGPLVACTRSSPRDVLAVSALALVVGLLLGIADHLFGTGEHLTRLLIVVAGGAMALWISLIRRSSERAADLLTLQADIARVLTSADTVASAAPRLLATLGRQLGWETAGLWMDEPGSDNGRCVSTWTAPGTGAQTEPGAGSSFPIRGSSGILGRIDYVASKPREPDARLVDLMDALGVQLGEYVERKLAEEAVQQSEARKAAIVQASLDAVVTMDWAGRVIEFNPAAERTFGYSAEEAIGKELAELIVPPDLRERHRKGLDRYRSTRESRMLDRRLEMRAVRKDGSELPVELTITAIGVEPPVFTGYLRDLSERREAETLQNRLAAIVESSDDAILSKDQDQVIRSWNRGAERLYGYTAEEAVGMPIGRLLPEDRQGEEVQIFEQVLRAERVEHYETQRVRKDGSLVDVALTVSPLRDPDGTITGASVIARDISDRKRLDEQRAEALRMEQEARLITERAERRSSFLAEAQSVLSSTLDYETILRDLVRLAVPDIADWCVIDMVAPGGSLERLALAHVDPQKERLAEEIERRYPRREDPARGPLKAVLSRRSELIREITAEMIEQGAEDEEHARLIAQLGLRSAMVVPLLARDRALGAITFVSAESNLLFDEEDLALAEDLAARAATAVDNARLYGERSYIAETLQRSLMPERLPDVPGVDLAARYRAAGEGTEVGGDFYDIYRCGESTWGVAIGDVRGKGPRAAVVTGLARYTLRTASLTGSLPSHVLGTLNEAMVLQPEGDRFCTVAYASLELGADSSIRMTLGVGGHPLPFLVHSDGSVETVGTPGTLIGFMPDPEVVDETVALQPGDSLVFYTDGVSEARSPQGLFGEERLADLLRGCGGLGAAEIAERIESDVLEFREGGAIDDMAVLVLRVRERQEQNSARASEQIEPVRRMPA